MIEVMDSVRWILTLLAIVLCLDRIFSEKIHGHDTEYLITTTTSNTSNVPFSTWQLDILQDIYDSTNGDQWTYGLNVASTDVAWDFTQSNPDPCGQKWEGVGCDYGDPPKITALTLNQMNLDGTLPDSIGRFGDQLSSLTINQNPLLFGTIPSTISNLTGLFTLSLSSTSLSGSFPEMVFELPWLSTLSLNYNALSGTLTNTGWNKSQLLTQISLMSNNFYGPIPTQWFQPISITQIVASINHFTGSFPSDISSSCQLSLLDLSLNDLNGTLPITITKLSKLKKLTLFKNNFSGSIPSSLDKLTRLQSLELDTNSFTGLIPPSLLNLQKLTLLYLFNNHFTGSLPAFGSKYRMYFLNVFNNYLSGSLPANITAAGGMAAFDVHANFFTGSLPVGLMKSNVDMVLLYLHNNQFTGTIPSLNGFHELTYSRFDWKCSERIG